ncbi:MAG TPA: NAD(P)H-dependent glycerol-3-phosphate dehydrogenase [Chitinophagaceae bacterium]|nr:NAD(P)H-dependent glycerol-3-phosphate dehydrogenase [Chitinophagaceae bacterium]
MKLGIIGSGSWGTALAKILTDNNHSIHWWMRSESLIEQFKKRKHNPQYLSSANFDLNLLQLTGRVEEVIAGCDCIVMAVPSAYAAGVLRNLPKNIFQNKKIVSAIKGILPEENLLLNDYLKKEYEVALSDYFTILGPCHAEEVAAEKLSYLTFSGIDTAAAKLIASYFKTDYINTIENGDIYGVQYASVLKNIYALGAGIAHGLEYGDNFLSVLIANSADEMAVFLRKAGIQNVEVGSIEHTLAPARNKQAATNHHKHTTNYAASVYLGDLLVTCYSLYSRNRTFGNMIGKGYSVKSARLEMNMVAEGYNASKSIYLLNKKIQAEMPIAETVYKILWKHLPPQQGFYEIEKTLV